MTLLKWLVAAVVAIIGTGLMKAWVESVIFQDLLENSGFITAGLLLLAPVAIIAGTVWLVKLALRMDQRTIGLLLVLSLGAAGAACSFAPANVQTLVSDDCGVSWRLIPAGSRVPARRMPCEYKVAVPNYPMQGQTSFKTSFKDRVLAEIEVSYDYSITDAQQFVSEAKYLGKANTEEGSADASAYESAENAVIDKRIREVAAAMLIKEDIVDFSQAEFEDRLQSAVNEELKKRGVQLNSMAFVPTPEEQTRLAIDTLTAMKVYESRGLGELGQKVMAARAGATKIEVRQTPQPVNQSQD